MRRAMSIPTAPVPKSWSTFANAAPGFRADSGEAVTATAWLPSRGRSPPSVQRPGGGAAQIQGQGQADALVHTGVPGVGGDAIPILQACQGQVTLTDGWASGWTWPIGAKRCVSGRRWWRGSGSCRGHHDAGGVRAAWTPLFIGADAERLAPAEPSHAGRRLGAVGSDAWPTSRPSGGHCPQGLRRRGRGQPGQKRQRRY